MTKRSVVVLDYGSGNLRSAEKALIKAGAHVVISDDLSLAEEADGLIVPGVGAFAACVKSIFDMGAERMIEKRLIGNRPVLGICVGMQMMFQLGVEGGTSSIGLGQWPGVVENLKARVLPHMGWNTVSSPVESSLFKDLASERFYFVHNFAVHQIPFDESNVLSAPLISYTEYESIFVAAVENGPLSAVQFHPEKSGDSGIAMLKNWLNQL